MKRDNFDIREWQLYQMFLNESEEDEDFSVEAPPEWNVIELTAGDIITPDMWNDDINWTHDIRIEGFKPFSDENGYMIYLKHLDSSRFSMPQVFALSEVNSWLKDKYRVEVNGLNESEEEDFSVEAPPEWNMKLLSTGDTITPDMWDLNNSDLDDYVDSPNEDWIIDEVDGEDIEISTKVWGGEFWGRLKDINSVLKPGYRIVQNKDLFEDEEFDVVAPAEWNQELLSAGDTITPDMWDQSKLGRRKDYFDKPITIDFIGYNEFDDYEEELLVGLDLGGAVTEYDINFVNHLLKPTFKVVQNKAIFEEEDEFSVDAPEEWNYDYWEPNKDMDDDAIYESFIVFVSNVLKNKGVKEQHIDLFLDEIFHFGEIENYEGISSGDLFDDFQQWARTEDEDSEWYDNIDESDDEFDVVAPPEWNQEYLTTGDTIMPEMWKPISPGRYAPNVQDFYIEMFSQPRKIVKTWFDNGYEHQVIYLEGSPNKPFFDHQLKPEFQVVSPNNLNENEDDEFDVVAPPEWNIADLEVGGVVTPDMWNVSDPDVRFNFKRHTNYLDRPHTIEKIERVKVKGKKYYLLRFDDGSSEYSFHLKKEYQRVKGEDMFESEEDEFSVEAPPEWNVTDLGVGDTVTSNMFKIIGDRRHWMDKVKKLEILKFSNFGVTGIVHLSLPNQNETYVSWVVDNVNKDLKSNYRIALPLSESEEDEFSVEAPAEWNVTDLGVGDIITPKMWDDNKHGYGFGFIGTLIHEPIKIVGFDEDSEGKFVKLQKSQSTWQKIRNKQNDIVELDISEVNDELKSQFRIVYPINETKLSRLLEMDDDEF